MIAIIIISSILGLAILFTLSAMLVTYFGAFYNAKRKPDNLEPLHGPKYDKYDTVPLTSGAKAIPYEEVHTQSKDGLNLFGRYYHKQEGKPISLQFNGYKGNGLRDMAGGLQLSLELGYNVLLTDQRAHGYSEGKTITFGIKERFDVISWINYIKNRFGDDTKIIIQGISMGAATVLMAADIIPDNVVAIIADCPYSSPKEMLMKYLKVDMKLPAKFIYPFMYLGGLMFGHFKINESSAVESVKKAKVPILVIHGDDDDFVPLEMSEKIYHANEEMVTLVKVHGAPHGMSFLQDYGLYRQSVIDFYKKHSI